MLTSNSLTIKDRYMCILQIFSCRRQHNNNDLNPAFKVNVRSGSSSIIRILLINDGCGCGSFISISMVVSKFDP
jgi:hypothetical protein